MRNADMTGQMTKTTAEKAGQIFSRQSMIRNLKDNFPLILSGFCFMFLNMIAGKKGVVYILISYLFITLIFSRVSGIKDRIRQVPLPVKLFSLVSAFGVCFFVRRHFFFSGTAFWLQTVFGFDSIVFFTVISYICAFLSLVVIFVLTSLLTDYTFGRLSGVFRDISRAEMAVCFILVLFLCAFVTYSFCVSRVFWRTNLLFDAIFTSDTPVMIRRNVYLNLYHISNDIRQPYFAVFAAPFIGFGYALSVPLEGINPIFTPLFMNYIQLIMLIAANYMLAKMLPVDKTGSICFMILSSLTYCDLLSAVMMEQYIVVYFWLIFVLYFYMENKEASIIEFTAATGTLVTNFVLTPFLNESYARDKRRECTAKIARAMRFYLALFLAFGRLDLIYSLFDSVRLIIRFSTGEPFSVRLNQYSSFIASCFTAPETTAVLTNAFGDVFYSLQLSKSVMYQFSTLGGILFALCVISLILNRKKQLARMAGAWIGFSVFILLIVGWGSPENGMLLYSLYFSWAFIVLLFMLLQWISEKLNIKLFIPVVSFVIAVLLIVYNYRGMEDLLSFAITYYPV